MSARAVMCWLLVSGCAASSAPVREGHELSRSERVERAAKLAPDLYARAQQTFAAAERASGQAEDDLEQAAELWLEAACEEADRIALLRQRREHEAKRDAEQGAQAGLDRARLSIEADIRREEAARIARAEAVKMLALSAEDERARDRAQEAAHAEVAAWLIARAELTLAAARALGLPESDAAGAAAAIARAAKAKAPRLDAAKDALASAERAVGRARALRPAATEDERAALLEMAAERSLVASRDARGVVLDIRGAFAPGASKLSASGRKQLAHVLAIARAHPHGPIHIEAPRARGDALLAALASEPERARFSVLAQDLPDRERMFIVFVGYGDPALNAVSQRAQ
jgi:hypothetical protein